MDDIVYNITQQWLTTLKSRIQYNNKPFLKKLESFGSGVFKYEDPVLLERALDLIPIQRFYDEADPENCLEDTIIKKLLYWFKNEFFTWVNSPPCEHCNKETRSESIVMPTPEERRYDAYRVETYRCTACFKISRFPRYKIVTQGNYWKQDAAVAENGPIAVGAEARIVYDSTDHVWTEVYSEFEQRWIHCDACEDAWDRPLLYSLGWGKKLSYCIAFSTVEALDVTKRYTRDWPVVLQRRKQVREIELALFLDDLTQIRQQSFSLEKKKELNQRRVRELLELEEMSAKRMIKEDELVGRQSGSAEWRQMRGEQGNDLKKETRSLHKFTLLGSCRQLDSTIIRLTDNTTDQTGAFYHPESVDLTDIKGIEVEFALRIIGNGADGLAFVVQTVSKDVLGEGGCQLGYGGIKQCVAVEFDTYQSSDRCADPSGNHISVHARKPPFPNSAHHDYSLGHTSSILPLATGQWIHIKVQLDRDGVQVGLRDKNQYIQVLDVCLNTLDYLNYPHSKQAWIGFTASTGGLAQIHDVQLTQLNVYYK
ncbi:concanavalin A-like lectin/glucanase [Rhizopus microsporus ATCC 52813]|uniref:Concanavalin A-like lectin/glucanase n=1 Tax=Rhizopus microsporus ATCC 52813 TaxID=1340429 RepID=A0A2G4SNA7_RHIZD|nr:concanavalin A-like lectin/glucanase [Rhizopus microsporus ATCC 52813]PHZ10232.1 concanavalin A-like lectin/glucanase [Rhizopus microsporus ATCC 52813]